MGLTVSECFSVSPHDFFLFRLKFRWITKSFPIHKYSNNFCNEGYVRVVRHWKISFPKSQICGEREGFVFITELILVDIMPLQFLSFFKDGSYIHLKFSDKYWELYPRWRKKVCFNLHGSLVWHFGLLYRKCLTKCKGEVAAYNRPDHL